MKRMMRMLLALAAALGLGASAARAANVTDSLTVTITPNAFYAVSIATTASGLDLGTVNLGGSTQTVRPSTVTIESSYAATELQLEGQMLAGGWTFDDDTSSNDSNSLQAWAVFSDTGNAATPTQGLNGAFSGTTPNANGSDLIDNANLNVGTAGGLSQFVLASGAPGYKTMENIPNLLSDTGGSKAHLWLYFKLPSATSTPGAKQFMLTLTAVDASLND